MGLPNINITFKTAAAAAVKRSEKGVVAVIVRDTTANGAHLLTSAAQIPEISAENRAYVERTFLGNVSAPRKVILYVLKNDAANLDDALAYLAAQSFDYLVGPANLTEEEGAAIASWIKSQRANDFTPKAVLPNVAADSEAIVNFTTTGIKVGEETFTPAQYCSRIAGLIAGTPMTISCTYALLPEVTEIDRLTKEEMDEAIDGGEFILYHDGEKVKVGRGVNSLQTTTADRGEQCKKIKIVEAMDLMKRDITTTMQDSYIGKYANSYDTKCILMTAISGYLASLEQSGILKSGSEVGIDLTAQENYLKSVGIDTSDMDEQAIKEADTADKVFLAAKVKVLDAIEDITLDFAI